jgi:hypothetical protein
MASDLNLIFHRLKAILEPYGDHLEVTKSLDTAFELQGTKPITMGKKSMDRVFFGSVVIGSGKVTYHFFPVYTHPQVFAPLPEKLAKAFGGKSCIHVKREDPELYALLEEMTEKGFELYRMNGWL